MSPKLCGYKHVFSISDFWSRVFRSPFYAWYSKNWNSEGCKALRNLWGIPVSHVLRERSFKGAKDKDEADVSKLVSLPMAGATAAGVITLLATLGQNRGLAQTCQIESLKVLERLCSCIGAQTFELKVLPELLVEVFDLNVKMPTFWDNYLPQQQKSLKQRCL